MLEKNVIFTFSSINDMFSVNHIIWLNFTNVFEIILESSDREGKKNPANNEFFDFC